MSSQESLNTHSKGLSSTSESRYTFECIAIGLFASHRCGESK